jgi:hypothetical protein
MEGRSGKDRERMARRPGAVKRDGSRVGFGRHGGRLGELPRQGRSVERRVSAGQQERFGGAGLRSGEAGSGRLSQLMSGAT